MTDDSASQIAQMRLWISALSHVVSRLEQTHSALVEAMVSIPWTTMDAATVKSYIHFVGMLLSARPEYLSLVLGKITQGFTYRVSFVSICANLLIDNVSESGLQALDANVPEGSSSPLTRRVIYDRLHTLLRHIYSLIPTLPSTLQPLLVSNFPHKRQNQVAQTTYIRNLLRVAGSCPELADAILATIIEHAIQIDVCHALNRASNLLGIDESAIRSRYRLN
jgi:RNA polymerase I-specific transcription initiation factor RRN3